MMLHCLIADFDLIDRPTYCERPANRASSNDEIAEAIAREIIQQVRSS